MLLFTFAYASAVPSELHQLLAAAAEACKHNDKDRESRFIPVDAVGVPLAADGAAAVELLNK